MTEPKRIDIAEFREFGYLHEVNRCFLHPLGLALEVETEECEHCHGKGRRMVAEDVGSAVEHFEGPCPDCSGGQIERLGGIWDCRENPEGITYGEDLLDPKKAARVAEQFKIRTAERTRALGYAIQPVTP